MVSRRSVPYVTAMRGALHREKGYLPGEMEIICIYVNLLGVRVPTTAFIGNQVNFPGQSKFTRTS